MKHLSILIFMLCCTLLSSAQVEEGLPEISLDNPLLKPNPSAVVEQHKDKLKLTLIVDSIIIGKRKLEPKFQTVISINFESDYVKINDSLYLKIFIARNQEYGSKFYTWKWDFLKKKGSRYYSQGSSFYEVMEFNGGPDKNDGLQVQGHGVGVEGTNSYLMYYYKYKLE